MSDFSENLNGHILFIGGPGSGKTFELILYIKKIVIENNISPDDVWVMAFNRDISIKLKEKIFKEIPNKFPNVSTIHSFILQQTLKFGAEILGNFNIADGYLGEFGLDKLFWNPIQKRLINLHGIKKTTENKQLTMPYVKNKLNKRLRDYWLTGDSISDTTFIKFIFEVERLKKVYNIIFLDELAKKFLDSILVNPSLKSNVIKPWIIIDEFQDLNPTEHKILQQFNEEGVSLIVFGDDDQAINDFRKASGEYVYIFQNKFNPTVKKLERDKRCPKEILELADKIVEVLPNRIEKPCGCAPHKGQIDILNFKDDDEEKIGIKNIISKYISVYPIFNAEKNPQVLLLTSKGGKIRGESRIHEIIELLKNEDSIPNVTGEEQEDLFDNEWGLVFKSIVSIIVEGFLCMNLALYLQFVNPKLFKLINDYIEEFEASGQDINFLNAFMELKNNNNEVLKVYTDLELFKNKAKEQEFSPEEVKCFIPDKIPRNDKVYAFIQEIWSNIILNKENIDFTKKEKLDYINLFFKSINNQELMKNKEIGRVHVTTYRKSKGLEADLVIISSTDLINFRDDPISRRILYVSITRSKKNLIITFPNKRIGARRFSNNRNPKFKGNPLNYRSKLIPVNYTTQRYNQNWLDTWNPI